MPDPKLVAAVHRALVLPDGSRPMMEPCHGRVQEPGHLQCGFGDGYEHPEQCEVCVNTRFVSKPADALALMELLKDNGGDVAVYIAEPGATTIELYPRTVEVRTWEVLLSLWIDPDRAAPLASRGYGLAFPDAFYAAMARALGVET